MAELNSNAKLLEYLVAHKVNAVEDDGWLFPNGKFPATRATWELSDSANSGQLNIDVLFPDGRVLHEAFVGITTDIPAEDDGFKNFATSSLHVFLAAFWAIVDDDQVTLESWTIGNSNYDIFIGNYVIRSWQERACPLPQGAFSEVQETLTKEHLNLDLHWVRTYYCKIDEAEHVYEALLDNKPWDNGVEALKRIPWPQVKGCGFRHFFILRRRSTVKDIPSALPRSSSLHARLQRWFTGSN